MKFKLDENLGSAGRDVLEADGHDVMTVADQSLSETTDEELYRVCSVEERVLVTLDHDFGQTLRFPPSSSAGIVVLELRGQLTPTCIRLRITDLAVLLRTRRIGRELWIIEAGRLRIHQPTDLRS